MASTRIVFNEPEDAEFEEMTGAVEEHAEQIAEDITNPFNSSDTDIPIDNTIEPEKVSEKKKETFLMIDGKMLIFLIDTIIPFIIKLAATKAKYKCNIIALKLDPDEKQLLAAPADEVAKIIFGELTPIQQFFIGLTIMYSSKIPEAISK